MTEIKQDRERVERYVRRFWDRHQEWPRLRKVARGLRISQDAVQQAADDGLPLMLTSYFVEPPDPLGEHFVEICE